MAIEDAYQRYVSAAHAMQSGVAAKMEHDPLPLGLSRGTDGAFDWAETIPSLRPA
jgi:hypothetical protein